MGSNSMAKILAGHGGSRLTWREMPEGLRFQIEERLGSSVVEARSQPGGFSPGLAARLRLGDGGSVFVKAAGPEPNPDTPEVHRAEVKLARELPEGIPTPRLLWTLDEGGWVVLAFEDIEGQPPQMPWRQDELSQVLVLIEELSVRLTPSPISTRLLSEALANPFNSWRRLLEESESHSRIDPRALARLDHFASLEENWALGSSGETLIHLDIRADNLIMTPSGPYVVDWPHACIGAPWVDLALFLPSLAMQGGPRPWEIFETHPVAAAVDPKAATSFIAAMAGFFVRRSVLPPPPGLPTIREFQRLQGEQSLDWLLRRA